MKKIENYEEVEELKDFAVLTIGPKNCVITNVIDEVEKQYLKVEFDIVGGELDGYYADLFKKFGGKYRGSIIKSYKPTAASFFKGFITSVEESNKGFTWDWNEKTLVGKKIVVNFREEEYINKENMRATVIKPFEFRSFEALRNGKINLAPAILTLEKQHKTAPEGEEENTTQLTKEEEELLPF